MLEQPLLAECYIEETSVPACQPFGRTPYEVRFQCGKLLVTESAQIEPECRTCLLILFRRTVERPTVYDVCADLTRRTFVDRTVVRDQVGAKPTN